MRSIWWSTSTIRTSSSTSRLFKVATSCVLCLNLLKAARSSISTRSLAASQRRLLQYTLSKCWKGSSICTERRSSIETLKAATSWQQKMELLNLRTLVLRHSCVRLKKRIIHLLAHHIGWLLKWSRWAAMWRQPATFGLLAAQCTNYWKAPLQIMIWTSFAPWWRMCGNRCPYLTLSRQSWKTSWSSASLRILQRGHLHLSYLSTLGSNRLATTSLLDFSRSKSCLKRWLTRSKCTLIHTEKK